MLYCPNSSNGENHYIVFINNTSIPIDINFNELCNSKPNGCIGNHTVNPKSDYSIVASKIGYIFNNGGIFSWNNYNNETNTCYFALSNCKYYTQEIQLSNISCDHVYNTLRHDVHELNKDILNIKCTIVEQKNSCFDWTFTFSQLYQNEYELISKQTYSNIYRSNNICMKDVYDDLYKDIVEQCNNSIVDNNFTSLQDFFNNINIKSFKIKKDYKEFEVYLLSGIVIYLKIYMHDRGLLLKNDRYKLECYYSVHCIKNNNDLSKDVINVIKYECKMDLKEINN
jgi:hypothetical protein